MPNYYIPIEDTVDFSHKSGTTGPKRALLIDIAGLAQTLHYTGASYDVRHDAIVFHKGAIQSRPLSVSPQEAFQNIYFMLYFEVQAQHGGVSDQLAGRLDDIEKRLQSLELANRKLQQDLEAATTPQPVETIDFEPATPNAEAPVAAVTVLPSDYAPAGETVVIALQEPVRERFYGDSVPSDPRDFSGAMPHRSVEAEMLQLRAQAISMGGILTATGKGTAIYKRPSTLSWDSALEKGRRHSDNRVWFEIPREFAQMRRTLAHDQALLADACAKGCAAG